MKRLLTEPIDRIVVERWECIPVQFRKAFQFCILVSVLAFGFEMSNLILHHDDVLQIFVQHDRLQQYVGRFGFGWLHYYVQGARFMPFVQMAQGIVLMAIYGMIVCNILGLQRTLEIALAGAILCVYPYVAQIYQYNSSMALYPLAHALSALAMLIAIRPSLLRVLLASLLLLAAFSIYQSVIANALTILVVWIVLQLAFPAAGDASSRRSVILPVVATLAAIGIGGILYYLAVKALGLPLSTYQGADKAFGLQTGVDRILTLKAVLDGTRASLVWPENYFPATLKDLQLSLLFVGVLLAVWLPKGIVNKLLATGMIVMAFFAPRVLQVIHPSGHYHNLTLTAYASLAAGALALIYRFRKTALSNIATCIAVLLLVGFIAQANWISSVNYLNMVAHFSTTSQILSRLGSLPNSGWDGRRILLVGNYSMPNYYPFKRATGVATDFIDPNHFSAMAKLLRTEVEVIHEVDGSAQALAFAATRRPWPDSESIGVVDGVGIVVLAKPPPGK